jgi:hypothetical protein
MSLLTEEQQLRAHFEDAARKSWGWENFAHHDSKSSAYQSAKIQYAWSAFKYAFELGKNSAQK